MEGTPQKILSSIFGPSICRTTSSILRTSYGTLQYRSSDHLNLENEEFNIGGTLIPVNQIPGRLDELKGLAESEVIVYCRSGNRSGSAKMFLERNGFTKVRNLIGGMNEWQKKIV